MPGRSQIPFVVVNATGDAIEDATVAITHRVGGAAATVYTSETSAVTLGTGTPQVNTQKTGRIPGWLPEGSYTLVITHASLPGSPWTRALDIAKGSGVGNLQDNVVTAAKVDDLSITGPKIADGAVQTAKLNAAAASENRMADNAASTRTIATGAVTLAKVASDAVDARTIATDAVTTTKIALLAVTEDELVDSAVIAGKFGAGAISTAKIADSAITTDKIMDSTITAINFAPGGVGPLSVDEDALPYGVIMPYVHGTALAGWYACDGTYYDPNLKPLLFSGCGYRYGQSGITFRVPDLRGRTVYMPFAGSSGIGALGATEGETNVALRGPTHSHDVANTISVGSTGSGHGHQYSAASDPKVGGMLYPYGSSLNNWRIFNGNYVSSFHSLGQHSHGFTGFIGDTNGGANQPSHLMLKYFIKGD